MAGERAKSGAWLRASAVIAAVPVVSLLILMAAGALSPGPGLVALIATLGSSALTARIWLDNLARLAARIRASAAGGGVPDLPDTPLLPSVQAVADGVTRLARSLAERGAQVEQLRRADAAIIEALPDPLLVLSADRYPLRANRAARDTLGAPQGSGSAPADMAVLLRHPAVAEALDRAMATGRPAIADLALPVPMPRDLVAQAIPLDPPLADGGRILVLLSDRTRERAVERTRADFVANASHELRTPLASLIGFIETLRGPAADDPAAQQRFLQIMAEQADRMRRLIDDLLGLSRIEVSEHQAPSGSADAAAMARSEAEALAPILAARKAHLVLDLPAEAVAEPADADQIGQVMRNLLDNAIRHGRSGGEVRLTVAAAPGRDGRGGIGIAVSDDGPGIPREHIPRLTERFYRVDKGRSRSAGGTGLGLAIVKHIVNRHRGTLAIESEEGVGTTFRVWLPGR
ncbi:PAS domain-containing protein [Roseomonas terrae]|jgi:two-component system phosphate regulon sensor histidine kinase PhoR|uniref:histidine kinase n=1 Tax=Neoroseomonas terrae TaxID=424799 RepID=A0ABS5EN37_9PROT|nr:ATP-binding protein [Neoroseomonas terrae]MBR0652432.1 PAS domain-containing protein [Neoroseomonas terrae]